MRDADPPMDNAVVIRMTRNGASEQEILAAVQAAKHRTFSTSPEALKALEDAKVAPWVIELLRFYQPSGNHEYLRSDASYPNIPIHRIAMDPLDPVPPPPPILTLSTSAAAHKLGDPIHFTLIITEGAYPAPPPLWDWDICTFEAGTISVSEFQRSSMRPLPRAPNTAPLQNPGPLPPAVSPVATMVAYFPEPPWDIQLKSLVTLPSGGAKIIPLSIARTASATVEIFQTSLSGPYSEAVINPVTHAVKVIEVPQFKARVYQVDKPGMYTLRLRYQYKGLEGTGHAFRDVLESNEVIFTVQ